MEMIHRWEGAGHGRAPFRCVGIAEVPSPSLAEANPTAYNNALRMLPKGYGVGSCGVCGMPLKVNFLIESADGRKFSVGCECVKKARDGYLIKKVDALTKARLKAQRDAKREEKRLARLEEQRQRNGGKTDGEIAEENHRAWMAERKRKQDAVAAILKPLADAIKDGKGGFRDSIAIDMLGGAVPAGRGWDLVVEILAKREGRRGSAGYEKEAERIDGVLSKASAVYK